MADDRKSGKPYKLPAIGRGSSRERLSRDEFDNMVRNMGARAARDYMRDENLDGDVQFNISPTRPKVVASEQRVNRNTLPSDATERECNIFRTAAESVSRATGMKKGGVVKGSKQFPDLNKDGKITKADILKGRDVEGFKAGGKVAGFNKGGCVMTGRGGRFKGSM